MQDIRVFPLVDSPPLLYCNPLQHGRAEESAEKNPLNLGATCLAALSRKAHKECQTEDKLVSAKEPLSVAPPEPG